MRRSRHSVLLSEAARCVPVDEICRAAEVSLRTLYRWKKRLDCLTPASLRRLKQLEEENRLLRKLLTGAAGGHPASARLAGGYGTGRLS
jgi:hypothetical protein